MEGTVKTAVEVAMRRLVMGMLEETFENTFKVSYDEGREGIRTSTREIVEAALNSIVEQSCLDISVRHSVDRMAPDSLQLWTSSHKES